MFSYFIWLNTTNVRRKKKKEIRKGSKEVTCRPRRGAAGPAHSELFCRLPPARPSSSVAGRRRCGRHRDVFALPGPPVPFFRVLETRLKVVLHFPRLSRALPSSPRFPLLLREQPLLAVARTRGLRALKLE